MRMRPHLFDQFCMSTWPQRGQLWIPLDLTLGRTCIKDGYAKANSLPGTEFASLIASFTFLDVYADAFPSSLIFPPVLVIP